jgi:hypothetical protein
LKEGQSSFKVSNIRTQRLKRGITLAHPEIRHLAVEE